MKYSDWIEKWATRKEPLVKASTYAAYSNIIVNHLLPRFGNCELEDVTEEVIQGYVFDLVREGRLDRTAGLRHCSAKGILIVLKSTLRDAMRQKLIPQQMFDVRVPHSDKPYQVQILDKDVQRRLVQAIHLDLSCKSVGILVSLYTGLRIGEVCGLKWSDFDFENRLLSVRRTVQRVYRKSLAGDGASKVVVSTPKSRMSRREVPIANMLHPVLLKMRSENQAAYLVSGTEKCCEVRTFREFFMRFLSRHGIPSVRFHALRHTFATRCIEAGGDCKTVSELLGHATVNLTLNLYVHPQMEQKRSCVERLEMF